MRFSTVRWPHALLSVVLLASVALLPSAAQVHAAVTPAPSLYFVLTQENTLISINPAQPGMAASPVALAGLTAGETLVGMDVRPQNGQLYTMGVNATTNTASLYLVNPVLGSLIVVGTAGSIAYTTDGATAVDFPDPATVSYDFDFNPSVDRIRILAGSLNARANPNTGAAVDGDNGGAAGSVAGTNPDGAVNTGTTTVDSGAYTNSQANTTITTLYTLDSSSDSLYIQSPANSGTQVQGKAVTLGGSALDFSVQSGMDIAPGVNAPASNTAVTSGYAIAALTVGGVAGLYELNLVDAQASMIATLDSVNLRDLAVWSPQPLGMALSGSSLMRFRLDTPGTVTTVAITGIVAGETLVGIDGRPQTGQLYGLGVNSITENGTLYLIDPQTGAASAVGLAGQIAFVDAAGGAVDLPDPATSGYGFDFNPTVDRVRVVTSTGLNMRLNPITGGVVDGNLGMTPAPAGNNPDGPINGLPGGSTGVSATAYTNSFSRILGSTVTTQYAIDAASNSLYIQNPPNAGTQTSGMAITLDGAALDITDANGFDIPGNVAVTAANTPATGNGYGSFTVGGTTSLYRIDLASGKATMLGNIDTGSTAVGGLVIWSVMPTVTLYLPQIVVAAP